MNDKPVVEHVEAIADVAKVLDPLHFVPTIAHKPLVVERQCLRLLDEQIAVNKLQWKNKRLLAIAMQTGNAVEERVSRGEPLVNEVFLHITRANRRIRGDATCPETPCNSEWL